MSVGLIINDHEIKKIIGEIINRLEHPQAAFESIGQLVTESIRLNFSEGGRPQKWKPSQRAQAQDGETLRDTNRLMNTITSKAYRDKVIIGTNVEYAAVHHFGAKRGAFGTIVAPVKAHTRKSRKGEKYMVSAHTRKTAIPWGNIPARPFMMVQEEDWQEIREVLSRFVVTGT